MSEPPQSFKAAMLAALPALRAFAMSLSGRHDVADDLVQETVMKAWAKQDAFTLGTNMNAWLFTILRNLYYSQMRKRGREVQDVDGAFTGPARRGASARRPHGSRGLPPRARGSAGGPAGGHPAYRSVRFFL